MAAPALLTTAFSPGGAQSIGDWIGDNGPLLAWAVSASIGSLVLVAVLLPVIVLRLEPDYFIVSRRTRAERRGPLRWILVIAKNVVGALFVAAGIAMLVLPGQGILTILIGVLLLDFPGKRALELWLVRRPRILRFLNGLRARRGRPPLRVE